MTAHQPRAKIPLPKARSNGRRYKRQLCSGALLPCSLAGCVMVHCARVPGIGYVQLLPAYEYPSVQGVGPNSQFRLCFLYERLVEAATLPISLVSDFSQGKMQ